MTAPLSGLRVLDLTTTIVGPYCARILGDMGADVIKVENVTGDPMRGVGPKRHENMGAVFMNLNRNKRSITLDLKTTSGHDALLNMVKQCDVFVHNMRPKAIDKLNLGYEVLEKVNKRIVYAGIYGYRVGGPSENDPAYDDIIQGASGVASLQANLAGEPSYVAFDMADKTTGVAASSAIIAALYQQERTGEGQFVEVPMFETMVSFNAAENLYGYVFDPPVGEARYPRPTSKYRKPYKTLDGYVCPVIYLDKHWKQFFPLFGRPELLEDPQFSTLEARTENTDSLYQIVEELISTRTTDECMKLFKEGDIPVSLVKSLEDLTTDPQLSYSDFFKEVEHPSEGKIRYTDFPVRFSKADTQIRRFTPRLGEHSVSILNEFGFTESDIKSLLNNHVTLDGSNTSGEE